MIPTPRTARRRSPASQTAKPNAASVSSGSTHASVFRSWNAVLCRVELVGAEDHDLPGVGGDLVRDLLADADPVGGLADDRPAGRA